MHGLLWCFTFLILDAIQAVYLGGVLQRVDSFLLGALVFGTTAVVGTLWTWRARAHQLGNALANPASLFGLNATAAGAWIAYLLAVQLIEPAISWAIFSGVIPLGAVLFRFCGVKDAPGPRNAMEGAGFLVLAAGMIALGIVTLLGLSGFVRGGAVAALAGLSLSALAGVFISGMLLYSQRLDAAGVGPLAQSGLRFPLYVLLATAAAFAGFDAKPTAPPLSDLAIAYVVGLAVLAFPIYAVQKAVSLTSIATVGTISAAGPFVVFVLQMIEGRVDYAPATLAGLIVYFVGAIIAVAGSVRATRGMPVAEHH